jgi:hypothetical protein
VIALALAVALTGAAQADDDAGDALACVRTKVWDAYGDGWSLRTMSSSPLGVGERRSYALSLMPGRAYRVLGCATGSLADLDLALYDASGHVVVADATADGQPILDLSGRTGTFTLVVYGRRGVAADPGGAAFAVLHR